jgi:hypothetical protein
MRCIRAGFASQAGTCWGFAEGLVDAAGRRVMRCYGSDAGSLRRSERDPVMHISKFWLIVAGVLTAVSFTLVGGGTAYAVQEHMINARDDLNNALNELQMAVADKGGHRVTAINLVNQAIDQVNQGIQFGAQ